MSNNQLLRGSQNPFESWEKARNQGSFTQSGNGREMNTYLTAGRTCEANRHGIRSGHAGDGSYVPFWVRKCGCAECIIANDKKEPRNFHNNQYGYQSSRLNECYLKQTINEYNLKVHQTKERKGEKQSYHAQLGNGHRSSLWPKKDRFTVSSDTVQTLDINFYLLQHQNNPKVSRVYQTNAPSQSGTKPVTCGTNNYAQWLNTDFAVKGNQDVSNIWAWNGSLNEFSCQNQQQLSNTQQSYPEERLSRDPRLRRKSELFNGKDALPSNRYSIYHIQDNSKLVQKREGNIEGKKQKSKEKKANWHLTETNREFLQEPNKAAYFNVPSKPQYLQPQHTPSNHPERSAPAATTKDCKQSSDRWKDQRSRVNKLPQLTLKHLSDKRTSSSPLRQFTDSHNAIPWNHPYLPGLKTTRSSEADPKAVENFGSRNKRTASDFESFQNTHSLENKQQSTSDDKELENEAKTLEIDAREERIKKLKILLAKQEEALEALIFQRKSPYPDEKHGNIVNTPSNNETHSQKSGDQENISEESRSSSGADLGCSLKRRWIKNWNEEDRPEYNPPAKKERENEVHARRTQSENENQNLSNAEFTALEGLVRLGKD